ncbi:MAG: MBL fold metallo-hydrolase [Acidimicrobiales bacterium]
MGSLREVADQVFAWVAPTGGWGWSNAGLITDGRADPLLVDTLFDLELTGEMLAAMRSTIPAANHIGTLVNTHANGDHCYGNELAGAASIVASTRAAEEMRRLPASSLAALVAAAPEGSYFRRIFGTFRFEGISDTFPTRTFDGVLTLAVGSTGVELVELGPAHTAGDVIAWLPDRRVVFTGDLLFVGGHPIVWAGPISHWVAALDRIIELDPAVVVPGHGPVTDASALHELRAYFVELEAAARPLWEEGMSPLAAARAIRIDRAVGWGEAERLVVNVAACFREFAGSKDPLDIGELFEGMAELA